jgi:hypothetical protein
MDKTDVPPNGLAFSWALRGYDINRLVLVPKCHRSCEAREAQRLSCNAVLGASRLMALNS